MKKALVVANTILVFPFIYILICPLLSFAMSGIHWGGLLNEKIAESLITPLILAYFLIPDVGPFLFPLLTAFTLFSLWKNKPRYPVLLGSYLLVFFLYDFYVFWWYATGQKAHVDF